MVHPLLERAFAALEQEGVSWRHLPGDEASLLVAPADLPHTRQLLRDFHFTEPPSPGHGSELFLLSYHAATDRWIPLHIVTEVSSDADLEQPLQPRAMGLVRRLLGAIGRRRGMSVAVLGPDGSGKSTLAVGIERSFYLPVRSLYMGTGDDHLPRIARLPVPGMRAAVLLVTLWSHYLMAQYYRARGRLVLFDRYSYDALLPARRQLRGLSRITRWVRAHACPPPDLVLLLDVPGRVMYERKGEHSPEHLEAERRDFLQLQGRLPGLQVVDGGRAADSVRIDVIDRIWRRYAAGRART